MATGTLGVASTLVAYTDSAQADSLMARDANGDSSARKLNASSALVSAGGLQVGVTAKTANYTALASDHTIPVDATSGAVTITLTAAASMSGVELVIKKTDTSVNAVTVDGNASETIDGALTQILTQQYESITLHCNGTTWHVTERHIPRATIAKSATFTVDGSATDYLVTSGSAYVVNLPPAANCIGKTFRFTKVDSAAFGFVLTPAAGTINGAATKTTSSTQWTTTSIYTDGTNWYAF